MWKQAQERNRRLERRAARCGRDSVYYDEHKGRYVQYWISGRAKFVRTQDNRKFRRHNKDLATSAKGYYRKANEYWWKIY